jgi:hypothetical protein
MRQRGARRAIAQPTPPPLLGSPCTRGAAVAAGAGFGVGSAYADSRRTLRAAFPTGPPQPHAPPPATDA